MYVYIYIYIYMYLCIHKCSYIHTHARIHLHINVRIHTLTTLLGQLSATLATTKIRRALRARHIFVVMSLADTLSANAAMLSYMYTNM